MVSHQHSAVGADLLVFPDSFTSYKTKRNPFSTFTQGAQRNIALHLARRFLHDKASPPCLCNIFNTGIKSDFSFPNNFYSYFQMVFHILHLNSLHHSHRRLRLRPIIVDCLPPISRVSSN